MSSSCPDVDSLVALAEGRCTSSEAEALEVHVRECRTCRMLIAGNEALEHEAQTANAVFDQLSDTALAFTLDPGELAGRYRVISVIGEGAMGIVYEAEDPKLRRRVALKSLKLHPADRRTRSMLLSEAQALGKLQHPNVVPVFDVGRSQRGWFIAMGLIDGRPLGEWCDGRPCTSIVARFVESARGLAAAHAVGIVHRDFKPANVLVGLDDRARVADFGIAATKVGRAVESNTLDSLDDPRVVDSTRREVIGTLAYMAPEQLRGQPATERSDQYAFFVSLFEMLEGRRPFAGDDARAQLRSRKRGAEALAHRQVPTRLASIVAKGLSYEPDQRHESMTAVADALLAVRRTTPRRWLWMGGAAVATTTAVLLSTVTPVRAAGCMERATEIESLSNEHRSEVADRWGEALPPESYGKVLQRIERFTRRAAAEYGAACSAGDDAIKRCLDRRVTNLDNAVEVIAQDGTPADKVMDVVLDATPRTACNPSNAELTGTPLGPTVAAVVDGWNAQATSLYLADRYAESARLGTQRKDAIGRFGTIYQRAYAGYIHGLAVAMSGDSQGGLDELVEAHAVASSSNDDALAAQISIAVVHWAPILQPEDAESWRKRAEADVERAADERLRVQYLTAAGLLERRRGDSSQASTYARAATEVVEGIEDGAELTWRVESLLGTISLSRRDHVDALLHYERALDALHRLDGSVSARSLQVRSGLAQALLGLGDLEQARVVIEEYDAVADALELGAAAHGVSHGILHAELQRRSGDDDAAMRTLGQLINGLPVRDANWLGAMSRVGLAHLRRSEYVEARDLFEHVRVQTETAHGMDHKRATITLHNLAEAEAGLGELEQAAEHYRQALDVSDRTDPTAPTRAFPLTGLGEVELALGDLYLARAHLEAALAIELDEPAERAETQAALARTLWALGDPEQQARALALAEAAAAGFENSPGHELLALELERWLETL